MLHIHCLGQFSVRRDDESLGGATAQPKRIAILALLACADNRGLTRDKLITLLWPNVDAERARRMISQAIWALRRDLGEDAIEGQRDLRLNPDYVTADVTEFREAVASRSFANATQLYRGPLLDGFYLTGAPEFERWLEAERTTLAQMFAQALEKCAASQIAGGNHAAAAAWLRKLAAEDPTNPRVAIQLMQSLVASGDRTGAIRHAEIHAMLLKQELDLAPDPSVEAYAQELRTTPTAIPDVVFEPIPPTKRVTAPADLANSPASVEAPTQRRLIRVKWVVVAFFVAAAIVALFLIIPPGAEMEDVTRVAVLPLDNRTGDRTLDPIGIMAAEWITNGLLSTGLVPVVDARTMFDLVRRDSLTTSPPRNVIAQRTKAALLVSGSFYRERDTLLFRLEIVRALSGDLVRSIDPLSVSANRPTDALEPLRQRVTGALAVLLDNRLNNWTATTSQPPTFEAYQEFLVGMEHFGNDYRSAIRHFDRAAEIDPSYWQAVLWSGVSYSNLRDYIPADSLFSILEENRTQLAPYDQANLDYFYGGFVLGDWERSYQGARRMTRLAPDAAHALFAFGLTAVLTNRPGEAVDLLAKIDTDEGWGKDWSLRIWNVLTWANHHLGHHSSELDIARRMREQEPNTGWTRLHEIRALVALGQTENAVERALDATVFPPTLTTWEPFSPGDLLFQTGRELMAHGAPGSAMNLFRSAEQWFARAPTDRASQLARADAMYYLDDWNHAASIYDSIARMDPGNVVVLGSVGATAQRRGESAKADSVLSLLEGERRPYLFGSPRYQAARIAALRGEKDRAVTLLRQARREGSARIQFFHLERDFGPLSDYPPFQELLRPRAVSPP